MLDGIASTRPKRDTFYTWFLALSSVGIGVFLFTLYVGQDHRGLKIFHPVPDDTFMDFFNPLYTLRDMDPLPNSIYPPFADVLLLPFSLILPFDVIQSGPFLIRSSQSGLLALSAYVGLTTSLFIYCVYNLKSGSAGEKTGFVLVTLFSYPLLFAFERQNMVVIAVTAILGFVLLKDSKAILAREASLVLLAMAACLKVYPVLYIILLVSEKRYLDSLRVLIYCSILFIGPFFLFGGLSNLHYLFDNLSSTVSKVQHLGPGLRVDLASFLETFSRSINFSTPDPNLLSRNLAVGLLALSFFASFCLPSGWKRTMLVTAAVVASQPFSGTYNLLYFVVPAILLIDSVERRRWWDYLFLIPILLIMLPVHLGIVEWAVP